MKPATNSNAPAAIRPYASAILDPSKEQSDALRQTQRVFKNQQAIIQRRRSAVRPIWTGRRDTKFGEAVKVAQFFAASRRAVRHAAQLSSG